MKLVVKRWARTVGLFILLVTSVIAPLISTTTALAGAKPSSIIINGDIEAQAAQYGYAYALGVCMQKQNLYSYTAFVGLFTGSSATRSQINSGNWFEPSGIEPKYTVGWIINPQDGLKKCSEPDFIKSAVKSLGWGDNLTEAACDLGLQDVNNSSYDGCIGGGGSLKKGSTDWGKVKAAINKKAGRDVTQLTPEAAYLLNFRTMELGCKMQPVSYLDDATDAQKNLMGDKNKSGWTVQLVNSTDQAAPRETIYQVTGDKNKDSAVNFAMSSTSSPNAGAVLSTTSIHCIDLAFEVNRAPRADNYLAYIKTHQVNNTPSTGLGSSTNCDPAKDPTCKSDAATAKPTCNVTGIGWIVCPVMTFLAGINDGAYGFLATNFLSVDTKMVTDPGVVKTWGEFRNIANIAFVGVFLFIIFSQVTSMGVSNYGLKRMLPRLLIAAILVNMSLILCQLAVDVSNVVGFGIANFFTGINVYQTSDTTGTAATVGAGIGWVAVIGGALAAVGGAVALLMAVSMPTLIAGVLAILMIVLIMIARKAIIILLIVVAPLAFVAYLLPNTESLFKKWYKLFYSMLILFPVIGVVFGASALAAKVISSGAGDDATGLILKISGLAVSVLPFFIVPSLLKGSLAATGALGTKLQGWSSKANSGIKNKVSTQSRLGMGLSQARDFRNRRRTVRQAKGLGKWYNAPFNAAMGGFGNARQASSRSRQIEQEEYEKEVKNAEMSQANMTFTQRQAIATGKTKASEHERDAAVRYVMQKGSFNDRKDIYSMSGGMTDQQKKSLGDGAYAAGDQKIFGSDIGDALQSKGGVSSSQLDDRAGKQLSSGSVSAETAGRDVKTAKYIRTLINGDPGDPSTGRPAVAAHAEAAKGKAKMQYSVNEYAATDAGKKLAPDVLNELANI